MMASREGKTDVVEILIKHGADVSATLTLVRVNAL